MTNKINERINGIILSFFMTVILAGAASVAARAESAFRLSLDGAQAGTNSNATGYGALIVNDAENRGIIYLKFSNLSGAPDFFYGVKMVDETGALLRFIELNAQAITKVVSFSLSAQEVAKMKQGKIFVEVVTPNFPSGEIRGKTELYSPFVARLRGANSNPPGDANGDGFAAVVLNKQENDGVIYYRYAGLSQQPSLVSFGLYTFESPGDLFTEKMWFFSQKFTVTADFISQLKRGRHSLRLSANLSTQLMGLVKPINKDVDFNGDGRADIAVFRPGSGTWYWENSLNGQINSFQFGSSASVPVPADFDGDGMTDYAVWLASNGYFYVWNSFNNNFKSVQWGKNGDAPLVGDYDGDGRTDFAVYRPGSNNTQSVFWILKSSGGFYSVSFGLGSDKPLVGDFDGDRATDVTVWRPANGTFYSLLSSNGSLKAEQWGISSDIPFVADFDADAISDYAVYRTNGAQAGDWYVAASGAGFIAKHWGAPTDIPVPADYDGDGRADFTVYRNGTWFISGTNSAVKYEYFGTNGDMPVTRR